MSESYPIGGGAKRRVVKLNITLTAFMPYAHETVSDFEDRILDALLDHIPESIEANVEADESGPVEMYV